jgi:Skp family chaperone for outer membrane proteins
MKTRHILFFTIALICVSFISSAQRGVRIGYIDMEYILENVPEYREASTQLDGKVQRWKADIEKKQQEVDLMKTTLTNERVLLTKELIEEREEEIKIKEDEMIKYQQGRFGSKGDLVIQRRQLVQPIQDQVFNIVQEVAENKKYDFIFDKSADVVMLFAAKRNDISDIVLRSITRVEKRKEATSKRERKEIQQRDDLSLEEDKEVTEREKVTEEKKDARQQMMDDRKRARDSLRAVKKAEYNAKRQRLLDLRQRRRDSIEAVRNGTPWSPKTENQGAGTDLPSGKSGDLSLEENKEEAPDKNKELAAPDKNKELAAPQENKEEEEEEEAAEEKKDPRQQLIDDRKRSRDSLRDVKKAEYDAKRQRLLDLRQRRRDSIQAIRNGTPWPPETENQGGENSLPSDDGNDGGN